MAPPQTSVILPACNAEHSLDSAVKSILSQTDSDFELLLIENGSTDNTAAIADELGSVDDRVSVHHLPSASLVAALRCGFEQAQGEFIARMDADDWSYPERIARQTEYLAQHPEVGLVSCLVEYTGSREAQGGYAAYVDWTNTVCTPKEIQQACFVESPFAHPSVVFRRSVMQEHGGWRDGDFPEDYELWLRWLERGVRMAKLPQTLLRWSDSPERLSRRDERYSFEAFYRCKAEYLARWLAKGPARTRPVLVWGAGRNTRKRAMHLTEYGIEISAWIDIDPKKCGQTIAGRPVLDSAELPNPNECFVVSYVANRGARDDIAGRLEARGFWEGRDFVLAA